MSPPVQKISFEENPGIKTGQLVETISLKKSVTKDAARGLLENYCAQLKQQLDTGSQIEFETIGKLYKDASGRIVFHSIDTTEYSVPIFAERLTSHDHNITVGDREISSSQRSEEPAVELPKKNLTWLYTFLGLLFLGAIILIWYFQNHHFTPEGIGNSSKFNIAEPVKTYKKIE